MTTDPSGATRPARLIGLALMGVAAVTAVIGVVTLVGGTGDTSAEPAPQSSQVAPATPTSGDLTSSPAPSLSSSIEAPPPVTTPDTTTPTPPLTSPPTSTPTQAQPPAEPPPAQTQPPAAPPEARDQPVRIYNNSFVKGLAERAAQDIMSRGWRVDETGNYNGGNIPTTTVYYQPGTGQEAAANQLAKDMGIRAEPRFDGIAHSSPGIILIVTEEYTKSGK
ncbi:LytR C-terminal domain-containing protein [Actinokineospora pegani]|uniref:LytR C-terminal domain-containing protein n=1 Tax=Actinokineospora pegani TaxID=2654637 RepID=UPI0012EAC001|nr:LytR C-terminal domain-containing protein [Actinokineospora pegani]